MSAAATPRAGRPRAEARSGALRPMHISLRAGERLFLNGAVLRADKKVTLELLNDATFLLENHVLQVEDTHTPLRQIYFAAQAMLMDPQNAPASRALFEAMVSDMRSVLTAPALLAGLEEAREQVAAERPFHALKTLRALFCEEAKLLHSAPTDAPACAKAPAGQAAQGATAPVRSPMPDAAAIGRTGRAAPRTNLTT